jgi:hypothetical protein
VVGPAAGAAGADGFAYAALAAPVVLQAGKPYYVTQTCAKGMPDMFTNSDADAGAADQLLASLGRGVFSADGRPNHFPDQHSTDSQYKCERRHVGPEVGPTSALCTCISTGMRGQTCICWANLTPFPLSGTASSLPAW